MSGIKSSKHCEPIPLYRANVGIALFNAQGRVLICRRFKNDGPEIITPGREWQMPQGGVKDREFAYTAARRELFEETGVIHSTYITEISEWLNYDFPPYYGSPHRLSRYQGQRQKWFAFRFTGCEDEIDVGPKPGAEAEFDMWRWEELACLHRLIWATLSACMDKKLMMI
jgi:putative (di)nucleoside polyphosphate hydrolase